jgi:putative aldouronate transport system substrate-binding protein
MKEEQEMKRYLIRALFLATAAMLCFAGLGACGKAPASQTTAPATSAPAEKMTLSYSGWVPGIAFPQEGSWAEKVIEETFPDVDWKFYNFERATWEDQINTMIASGTVPDIIYRDDRNRVANYVYQDILEVVPYDLVKKNAPEAYEAINKYTDRDAWLVTTFDQKNYGVPMVQNYNELSGVMGYRGDWMEKLGVSEAPKTLDGLTDLARKFANGDPDGNGAKDTYAFSTAGKNYATMRNHLSFFFSMFGILNDTWNVTADGSLQYGLVMDKARDVLALLRQWYDEGLLDREFITTDDGAYSQKWANGKFGMLCTGYEKLLPGKNAGDKGGKYYSKVHEVNPDAWIMQGPLVKGPNGDSGNLTYGYLTSAITFRRGIEPEKLERALQIVNACMTNKEFNIRLRLGDEGVHWTLDKATNMPSYLPEYNTDDTRNALGLNGVFGIEIAPFSESYTSAEYAAQLGFGLPQEEGKEDWRIAYEQSKEATVVAGKSYIPWANQFYSSEVSKLTANTQLVESTWMIEFIIGSKSLDQFDEFVKQWMDAGGQKMTEAANEAYQNVGEQRKFIADNTQ